MSDKYNLFYNQYKNKLFSYLLARSKDYEVAQDVMQESFTRHYKYYGHEAVISPALLFTIARNALTDHYRYQDRFRITGDVNPQVETTEQRTLESKEKAAAIHAALGKLSEVDQEILTLAVTGVQYKEIAVTLKLTEANVKVRVHRARVKLREIMKKEVT